VSCDGPLGPGLLEVLVGDDVVGDVVDHHHVLPVRLDVQRLGQRQGYPLGPGAGLASIMTHAQGGSKVTTYKAAECIQVRLACDTITWLACMPQHKSRASFQGMTYRVNEGASGAQQFARVVVVDASRAHTPFLFGGLEVTEGSDLSSFRRLKPGAGPETARAMIGLSGKTTQ
jgi:hypothetical protein